MHEIPFCQNEEFFSFKQKYWHAWCFRNQWWTSLISPVLGSKLALLLDSYVNHGERGPVMLFGGFINLLWQYLLFRQLDHPFATFLVACCIQGTLGLQLVGNHYTRPWCEIEDQKYVSFPERQVEVNINYKNSRWFDWFFGGLNFHNEHHMFPCMPRPQLRLIAYDLKALCKKHDVCYEYVWFH